MQRKQILKGKVYLEKYSTFVRFTDTTISPAPCERYDLIQQTWVAGEAHPRDVEEAPALDAERLVAYAETVNAAIYRRDLIDLIDRFQVAYGVVVKGVRRHDFKIKLQVAGERSTKLEISAEDFASITRAEIAPPVGTVSLTAEEFTRWCYGTLGFNGSPGTEFLGLPGVPSEYLKADVVAQVVAEQQRRREIAQRGQAVVYALQDEMVEEVKAARPDERYVSRHKMDQEPGWAERLAAALQAAGLDESALTIRADKVDPADYL
jgi:hypothetical protein